MIFARLIVFFAALAVAIFVSAPLQFVLRRAGQSRTAETLQIAISRLLCAILRLRVRVAGRLPTDRPALVVANHVSWTDILVFGASAPLCFLAKSDVAAWPLLGHAVRAHGTLFVSRRRTKTMPGVNRLIAREMGRGKAVVLFAEGTTGNGTRLEPFHSGHLAAAQELLAERPAVPSVSLVPAAIAYTRRGGLPAGATDRARLAWFGDMPLLPHVFFLLRHGPVCCDLAWGEPLPFRRGDDRKVAIAQVRRRVHRDFSRLVGGGSPEAVETVHRSQSAIWFLDPMPTPPTRAPSGRLS